MNYLLLFFPRSDRYQITINYLLHFAQSRKSRIRQSVHTILTGDQTRKYQRVSFGEKQVLIWLIKQSRYAI